MNLFQWAAAQGAVYYLGGDAVRVRMRDDAARFVRDVRQLGGEGIEAAHKWATSLGAYVYEPLPTESSIRLLSFARDDEFTYSCSLHVFDLATAPPFHALSYTWGNPFQFPSLEEAPSQNGDDWDTRYAQVHRFKVDGKALDIRPGRNLNEALERLWFAVDPQVKSEYLWVDAICINQQDGPEQTAQIIIMDQIYQKATKVVAWLGPKLESTVQAFGALRELHKIPQYRWTEMQTMDIANESIYAGLGIKPITKRDRQTLSGLMTRGWFNRVWILQEAVFANCLVFFCGGEILSEKMVFDVSTMLVLTGWSTQLMKHDMPTIASVQMVPPGGIAAVALMREQLRTPGKPSLLNIMASTRSRNATVPADSVYGVLNVLAAAMQKQPRDLLVQPDKKTPLEEIMEQTTLMIIRHEKGLWTLHQVQDRSVRTISGCSSWTVNWRQRMAPQPLIMASQHGVPWVPAGRDARQRLDTSFPRQLRFQAARVGTIVEMSSVGWDSPESDPGAWLLLAAALAKRGYGTVIFQDVTEILWRSMIADFAMDRFPAPSYMGYAFVISCLEMHCLRTAPMSAIRAGVQDALFCEWVKQLKQADKECPFPSADDIPAFLWALRGDTKSRSKPSVARFLDQHGPKLDVFRPRLDSVMTLRRLARTDNNLLAVVPESSKIGNSIWAVPELETPFVFGETGTGSFELIGESYVHGIMRGTATGLQFREVSLV